MTKPISPDQLGEAALKVFPPEVFEAFNELIVANWSGHSATVYQEDVVNQILEKIDVLRSDIFAKGWLNVEEAYRSQGWDVTYDKPGYNESYRASFKFRRKK